ncbi:ARM repeat superfamily protein [Actinidia rufa]|uniref:ARM repeat superfamily protein n=1 Tax=Actinidia rufa TaxID=165716 RepID=A0A7J0ED35_9ERIC|nr:ARM repeat superfamily protein [Actinidia rufa]
MTSNRAHKCLSSRITAQQHAGASPCSCPVHRPCCLHRAECLARIFVHSPHFHALGHNSACALHLLHSITVLNIRQLVKACLPHAFAIKGSADILFFETVIDHVGYVLMHTRSDKVRSRILGLRIVKYLVENLKEEYLVFLAETIPFLGELLEDVELPVKSIAQEILKEMESTSGFEFKVSDMKACLVQLGKWNAVCAEAMAAREVIKQDKVAAMREFWKRWSRAATYLARVSPQQNFGSGRDLCAYLCRSYSKVTAAVTAAPIAADSAEKSYASTQEV